MKLTKKERQMYGQLSELFALVQMLIVTGTYWGDEGKGKIVDALSRLFDLAVRYSGGAGAGHTLVTPDGKKFIGHLIPCGIAQGIRCILGRGVFFDLRRFLVEYKDARRVLGKNLPDVWIDKHSPVWTKWHELFEKWLEYSMGKKKVGTTGKAIGPLAGLNVLRAGLQVHHLYQNSGTMRTRLQSLYRALKPDFDEMVRLRIVKRKDIPLPIHVERDLMKDAMKIRHMVADTASELSKAYTAGLRVLFEGAQAPGLDIDMGTWPFVSAGHSVAAGAPIGTGLPLSAFAKAVVLMVMKILPTRVGAGPFPSELWNRKDSEHIFKGQYFQVLGYELGATTGRGRSVGLPDLMWLYYTIRINGPSYFALTRLDMLSGLNSIPVVVGYVLDGKRLPRGEMPDTDDLTRVQAVYERWTCWPEDITGITQWSDLPLKARQFVRKFERRLGVPIAIIGTGPRRNQMIVRTCKN
ncbi:MAG: adenylosuccinate synthetase [Patescibacteria group bacterium]|jgi:adenylosuccinate synthase